MSPKDHQNDQRSDGLGVLCHARGVETCPEFLDSFWKVRRLEGLVLFGKEAFRLVIHPMELQSLPLTGHPSSPSRVGTATKGDQAAGNQQTNNREILTGGFFRYNGCFVFFLKARNLQIISHP